MGARPWRWASDRRCSSRRGCRPTATGGVRSTTLPVALAADAERCPRQRFETLLRDLAAAVRARAVRSVFDSLQRRVDLAEEMLRVLLERVVELAVVGLRRGVGEMVVVGGLFAGVFGQRAAVLLVEVLEGCLDSPALFEQSLAETIGVDCIHETRSLPTAEVNRRSTRFPSIPASSTILSRELCPETSFTASRGTERVSASRRTTASFARPASGGAATRTFQASPYRPTTAARSAPGDTRSRRRVGAPSMQ